MSELRRQRLFSRTLQAGSRTYFLDVAGIEWTLIRAHHRVVRTE